MILTTSMLTEQLMNYSDPAGKIMRMKEKGELFRLTRGVYETDKNTAGYCLAGAIYAPSYLSFDYALSCYPIRLSKHGKRERTLLPAQLGA